MRNCVPKSDPVRKLVVRLRDGSGSMVGIPVADVVVVHVLVDMRRRRFGGTKRFPLCLFFESKLQLNDNIIIKKDLPRN